LVTSSIFLSSILPSIPSLGKEEMTRREGRKAVRERGREEKGREGDK
jgi:hypothetical protein